MKQIFALALCVLAVAVTVSEGRPDSKFTTKYDNVNLDEILSNEKLLMNYYNCIMDKGKCTADGSELKKSIPDAIKSECSGCSPKQKEGAERVIKYLHDNKKEEWNALLDKFDPDGSLRAKYKDKSDSFFGGR